MRDHIIAIANRISDITIIRMKDLVYLPVAVQLSQVACWWLIASEL